MATTDHSAQLDSSTRRRTPFARRRPVGARPRRQHPASAPRQPAASPGTDPVPESVRRRFVQVRNKYYFPDGARAFTDRGNRLTTPSENTEVVRSLIAIAKAREWNEITVRGTERFRKEAWFAARLAGTRGPRLQAERARGGARGAHARTAERGGRRRRRQARRRRDPSGARSNHRASAAERASKAGSSITAARVTSTIRKGRCPIS